MGMVSISESYMALLQDFSDKTRVPVERCVSDALFDWIANVAPVTLAHMGLEPLKLRTRRAVIQLMEPRLRR
jgi:hypothetical protein